MTCNRQKTKGSAKDILWCRSASKLLNFKKSTVKDQSNRIGNLPSGARFNAKLSQAQLAAKLGIRQNMVSDYERGKRRLSLRRWNLQNTA